MKQLLLRYIVPAIASIIFSAALVTMLKRHPKCRIQIPSFINTLRVVDYRMISYHELCCGTNNFCESNLLGTGGFGSIYKGVLFDGTIVAIKVQNLQLEGAFKSFESTTPGQQKKLQLINLPIKNFIFDLQVKESHEEGS